MGGRGGRTHTVQAAVVGFATAAWWRTPRRPARHGCALAGGHATFADVPARLYCGMLAVRITSQVDGEVSIDEAKPARRVMGNGVRDLGGWPGAPRMSAARP